VSGLLEKYIKYTLHLVEALKKARPEDYYVCDVEMREELRDAIPKLEAMGIRYKKTYCVRCGREVYALDVETAAKPLCIVCFVEDLSRKRALFGGRGG